jgi:hypothetical protein
MFSEVILFRIFIGENQDGVSVPAEGISSSDSEYESEELKRLGADSSSIPLS